MGIEYENRLIGYADLACIRDGSAELGIAIGESALWGRGLGTQSAKSMMAYGADVLGISNFSAETHETNLRSRKMLWQLGFEEVGKEGYEEYLGENSRLIQYVLRKKTEGL